MAHPQMAHPQETDLAPGTMVGAYRIEARLGAGGVGTVYAAEEPTIKKRVAIKVLRRSILDDSASAARFEREARAANEVRHPGIVEVFAIGALPDGRPYLVMSLLEGRSLRDELAARGRLSPAEAWAIAREVAEALGAAHAAGVIHRDLKPDNVFLERFSAERSSARPHVRLLDFGIAKVQSRGPGDAVEAPMRLTATGVPIGTPTYMAPEQWWCEGIDERTDQYAFGVMLFELCAGRPPFDSQLFVELVQKHVHEPPPSLADVGVSAPAPVEAFLRRLLAKAAGERFPSMHALLDEGDRAFAAEHASSSAAPPSPSSARAPSVSHQDPASSIGSTPDPSSTSDHAEPPPSPSVDLATSPTQIALPAPSLAEPPSRRALVPLLARAFRRYLGLHAALIVLGSTSLIIAGYAGPQRHDPRSWIRDGGFGQFPVLVAFLAATIGLIVLARRRARTGASSLIGFWIALLPALFGAFATYFNWRAVLGALERTPDTQQLALFNEGTYEANASRFLGFSLSALLLLSLSALPGLSGLASVTTTLSGALGVRRVEALAVSLGLALLTVLAIALGSPSGALIAGTAAVAVSISAFLPTVHGETAARDELERALAGLLAVALATATGLTRIEARESVLWAGEPTRAQRVAEILAAHDERAATWPIALIALVALVSLEALRVRRLARFGALHRPRWAALALLAVLGLALTGDLIQHERFIGKRDQLRAAIAAHFAVFARLDPPPGDELDPERFAPHRATALQITRDVVAVDAKGIARLRALESREGAAQVASDLNHALAQAAVDQREPAEIDLLVSIDRHVKGLALQRLLQIARAAGVRRVEILLTRGDQPKLSLTGPKEIGVVLPSDFVALPITLADEGWVIAPEPSFGEIAPDLVREAMTREGPVSLRVRDR
jgi:serine/threonine protein kinase